MNKNKLKIVIGSILMAIGINANAASATQNVPANITITAGCEFDNSSYNISYGTINGRLESANKKTNSGLVRFRCTTSLPYSFYLAKTNVNFTNNSRTLGLQLFKDSAYTIPFDNLNKQTGFGTGTSYISPTLYSRISGDSSGMTWQAYSGGDTDTNINVSEAGLFVLEF